MNILRHGMLDLSLMAGYMGRPTLYEKGTDSLWENEHISKHMLEAHLSQEHDAASRRQVAIDSTIRWMASSYIKPGSSVLDLGCGPGLYTERLARLGRHITGIDFSQRSISYARESAAKQGLEIDYRCQDYLTLNEVGWYDAAICIYCDFGALNTEERDKFLGLVHRSLKPGGIFIFDVFTEAYMRRKPCKRNYTVGDTGFWREGRHMVLSETFHYPEERTSCDQNIVVTENGDMQIYRTYDHYYSRDELTRMLAGAGFSLKEFNETVLECIGSEAVIFVAAEKR